MMRKKDDIGFFRQITLNILISLIKALYLLTIIVGICLVVAISPLLLLAWACGAKIPVIKYDHNGKAVIMHLRWFKVQI